LWFFLGGLLCKIALEQGWVCFLCFKIKYIEWRNVAEKGTEEATLTLEEEINWASSEGK